MRGNYLICETELFIEGYSIGSISSFNITSNRQSVNDTCKITFPIYTIGVRDVAGNEITSGVRLDLNEFQVKTGAYIELYAQYKSNLGIDQQFDRLLVFSGFIRKVNNGTPTEIECEDMGFPLNFGRITKDWKTRASLDYMVNICVDSANEAFADYRKQQGLTYSVPQLTYRTDSAQTEFYSAVWKEARPIQGITKLKKDTCLYAYINRNSELYIGIGLDNTTQASFEVSTDLNVTSRNIISNDRLFEDYLVEITAVNSEGKLLTGKAGQEDGEVVREPLRRFNTQADVNAFAQRILKELKGNRNEGTITLKLYPDINLYDVIIYNDTQYSELSGNYYVIGSSLSISNNTGFVRTLNITDQRFLI